MEPGENTISSSEKWCSSPHAVGSMPSFEWVRTRESTISPNPQNKKLPKSKWLSSWLSLKMSCYFLGLQRIASHHPVTSIAKVSRIPTIDRMKTRENEATWLLYPWEYECFFVAMFIQKNQKNDPLWFLRGKHSSWKSILIFNGKIYGKIHDFWGSQQSPETTICGLRSSRRDRRPSLWWMHQNQVNTRPGKHAKSYWKWPFIVDVPMKNGDFQ